MEKADPQNPKASGDRHPIIDFSVSLNPHCNIGILKSVRVETAIAGHPPHRSGRDQFGHPVPQ
jgi:hypothetical protein